jgi:predicted nucleic acid-binding Zn ribbon protein
MKAVGEIVPRVIERLLREGELSPGKVEFAWKVAVGSAMDRVTAVKFSEGVLLVDAKTPAWAREIRRSSAVIHSRLHALLGNGVVHQIVVRK